MINKTKYKKSEEIIPTIKQRKSTSKSFNRDRLYALANKNKEIKDTLLAYANLEIDDQFLLIQAITPSSKRTIINELVESYDTHTNIPLLIPIQQLFCYMAGYLNERNICIVKDKCDKHFTDIWVVLLASSGSAKSWSESRIADHFKDYLNYEPNISDGCESTAAYFAELKRVNGVGMLSRDEWGQHFKDIVNGQGPLVGTKGMYLKWYDKATLKRTLKKESDSVEIEYPHAVIFGQNVPDTFYSMMNFETYLDGFAQRFLYTDISDRKDRDPIDWLDLPKEKLIANWKPYFEAIANLKTHEEYKPIDTAKEIIKTHFRGLFKKHSQIPQSFLRRLYIATYKYSLLYHTILLKESDILDEEDINYACKFMAVHLQGIAKIKENLHFKDIEEEKRILEKVVGNLEKAGTPFTKNAIVRILLSNHKTKFTDANKTRNFVDIFYNE